MSVYQWIFTCFMVLNVTVGIAQEHILIKGNVKAEDRKNLQFVTVYVEETLMSTQTNREGNFSIAVPSLLDEVTIKFTMVGKKSEIRSIKAENFNKPINISLKNLSLTLDEVRLNPIQQRTKNSNSSIVFDEEAIEKIQAFSLMDVLNTIPGKATVAPTIDKPLNITLRGNQGGSYDMNNSLGVAIIVDGVNLSNDANMQSRSLSQFGMGGAALSGAKNYTGGDVPFQGIDLREIPVETIERIEVIQGVASAQFSELTDGAILIDRKAARTPWSFVTNVNGGSTDFSLSKGFDLSKKMGALNIGLNYAISNPDPKDKIKQYDRVSTSIMWSNTFGSSLKNTFSIDLSNRNDEVRVDPDDDTNQRSYSRNSGVRISNRLNWKPNFSFARTMNLTLSYSENTQNSYKQWLLNQSPRGYAYKDTTGVYEGVVLSGRYLAEEQIKGKPITASANLNLSANVYVGKMLHVVTYGLSSNYSNNGGKGIIADPDRPRWVNIGGQNARPYSFEYLDPLINVGAFVTDNFKVNVGNKSLISNFGMRLDRQNGSWSFQPRLSSVLKWNKNLDLTAAFGVSSKSPTMAHRYPAPTFLDIPLILSYNAHDALYLVHTEKILADNSHLKPSKSKQFELVVKYNHSWFNTSINAFWKNNTDGFSTINTYRQITVPEYTYYYDEQIQKILYEPTGNMTSLFDYGNFTMDNVLNSTGYGVDWMLSTRKLPYINSSLNFSTSLIFSKENPKVNDITVLNTPIEIGGENVWYVYYPSRSKNQKTNVMSKLGTTTHIPQLGFVVMTNLDVFWTSKTKSEYGTKAQSALGYINSEGESIDFAPDFANIPVRDLTFDNNNQPFVYGCLNLSVAKEMKKKFRIAVTAYNVLNIQPEKLIYSTTNTDTFTVMRYNAPLSITGGVSFKF